MDASHNRRLGIILVVVGGLLACFVPFILVVARHQQLEEISNPTPEELGSIHTPLIAAVAGLLMAAAGAWLLFKSSRK